jgi:hypothetical protein
MTKKSVNIKVVGVLLALILPCYEICGSNGGEDDDVVPLGYDAV